jgi:predicted transcriptional regulator
LGTETTVDTKNALLIKLPSSLVQQLDEAAAVMNIARVGVIRRSLMRDLQYVVSEELERTRRHQERQDKRYREWAALKAKVALLEG